jgi:hypothetical protein
MDAVREYEDIMSLGKGNLSPTVAATLVLAQAVASVALQLKFLGNADAATPMGAIEAFGKVMQDGLSEIGTALSEIGTRLDSLGE